MNVNEHDIGLCEQYLDHELDASAARQVDERLNVDAALYSTLEHLRAQRTVRLEAMSTAFDTDAASIERLVASVRTAQASEALRRKTWSRPNRTAMAAAASIAFGVIVGGVIQGRQAGHWNAASAGTSAPAKIIDGNMVGLGGTNLSGDGAYVVSLVDANGTERVKVHFTSAERARQFADSVNSGTVGTLNAGDARIKDESY